MTSGHDGDADSDGDGLASRAAGDGARAELTEPPPPPWRVAEVRRLGGELSQAIEELTDPFDLAADALPFAGAIVESLHEPLLVLRPNLTVHIANPAFYTHFKVSSGATEGHRIYDLGNGQWNIPALRAALDDVLPKSKRLYNFEVTHEFEGLGRRVMLINARRLDHVQLILIGIRDVTAEHGAAAALRESEARYRTIVENLPDYAMLMTDPRGVVVEWTEGAERVTGYSAAEAVGRHVKLIYTPEQVASGYVEREFAEAAETGRAEREDWRMRKGGERFWANEIVSPIKDAGGELCGFAKITRDLGERRWMENELRESEERFRLVVDNVKDYGIFMADAAGVITSWNPGAEQIFGFTRDEAVGMDARVLFTAEDQATSQHEKELELARQQGRASDDRWQRRKNGEAFWANGVTTALRDAAGNVVGFVKILRDETRRKQTEEQLKHDNEALERRVAERTGEMQGHQRQLRSLVAELGREEIRQRSILATELHDNLAQLLAVCKMRVAAIEAQSPPGTKMRKDAAVVKDSLAEAISYTRTLMTDLRPDVLGEHDLRAAVEWIAKRMSGQGLKVEVFDDGTPKPLHEEVLGFLFQAVRELLWNVVKHARTTEAAVHIERSAGEVRVRVEDNGVGFNPSQRAALAPEEGGYGLFSIAERIDLLGGRFEVNSARRRGTRVILTAPLDPGQGEPGAAAAAGDAG